MKYPAKLNNLERLLYLDDYPSHPNNIGCRLYFDGVLDETLIRKTTESIQRKHPLLSSSIKKRWNGPHWVEQPNLVIERISEVYLEKSFTRKIDVHTEPAYQLYWTTDEKSRSVINFIGHHACTDGIGGLQYISDWMARYDYEHKLKNEPETKDFRERRTDSSKLKSRGKYGFLSLQFLRKLPRQLIGLLGVWEFVRNRPVVIDPNQPYDQMGELPKAYPAIINRLIGQTGDLIEQSQDKGVTTNDLIVYSALVAVAKLRREKGWGQDHDLLRIMIPMNLRRIADRNLPATNRVSFVSIDRKQKKCHSNEQLLNSIRFQMKVVQENELGFTFLHVLNFYRWLPWGLKWVANPKRVGATMLITNLGEPFRLSKLPRDESGQVKMGDMKLTSFELLAPLRPNTQAAIAVYRYAGKMMVSLNYDDRALSHSVATSLADAVADQIQQMTQNDNAQS